VKFAEHRPFSDPEAAIRKLIEIANVAEAVQDARIYIERVNGPFLAANSRHLRFCRAATILRHPTARARANYPSR